MTASISGARRAVSDYPSGAPATDGDLLAALCVAASHKMTPDEIREQRVSWVFGQLKSDDPRSRDCIRAGLQEQGQ